VAEDQYAWLDHFADRLDLQPLREYCLKYSVLQQCMTRPYLVRRDQHYFGELRDDLAVPSMVGMPLIPTPPSD